MLNLGGVNIMGKARATPKDEKWLRHIVRCVEGGIADILESRNMDELEADTARAQGNWDVLHLVSLNKTLSHIEVDTIADHLWEEINSAYEFRKITLSKKET